MQRVVLATPLGERMLDLTLADIATAEERDARFWVERTAGRADAIYADALDRLVNRGILAPRDVRGLWLFRSRRYPAVDATVARDVKRRIMGVLFSDEIPHPRDVVIICLADACGLFRELLSKRELDQASPRIAQVRQLDLIGQRCPRRSATSTACSPPRLSPDLH